MERVLISTLYFPASVITTWAVVAISGIDYAPLYYMVVLFIEYCLFGLPIHSSYRQHPSGRDALGNKRTITKQEEGKLHFFSHT